MCDLDFVPVTDKHLDPDFEMKIAQKNNYTYVNDMYLTDYVDVTWRVFTPVQWPFYVQYDFTLKSRDGKYLLMIPDDERTTSRAIFITEPYRLSAGRSACLNIAVYKIYANTILEVYQSETKDIRFATKIWDIQRATNGWEHLEIESQIPLVLTSKDIYFYIVRSEKPYLKVGFIFLRSFQVGTIDSDSLDNAYIAVDNVGIKQYCQNPSNTYTTTVGPPTRTTPKPTTPDPKTHFTCLNGLVIQIEKLCDWINDCPQGEDEKECGSCDFRENNLCRYENTTGN